MQFHRKTSNSLSSGLIRLLIKAIIILAVISIVIFILDNIDLPTPNKILQKKFLMSSLRLLNKVIFLLLLPLIVLPARGKKKQ